jgi:hypothetical protein
MSHPNEPPDLLREMAALTRESAQAVNGSVTDVVGGWIAAQHAASVHGELAGAQDAGRWKILRACVQDWSKLRRGDHGTARLQLAREQLEWQRIKNRTQKEQEFREWLKRPEIRWELFPARKVNSRSGQPRSTQVNPTFFKKAAAATKIPKVALLYFKYDL